MEVRARRCIPFPARPIAICGDYWHGDATLLFGALRLHARAHRRLLSIQYGCSYRIVPCDVRPHCGHCGLRLIQHLQANGWRELGEKCVVDVRVVLRSARPHVLIPQHRSDCLQKHRSVAVWDDCHYHSAVGHCDDSAHYYWRYCGQERKERIQRPRAHNKVPTRDPGVTLVSIDNSSDVPREFPSILCDLHRALLHIRLGVGTQGVYNLQRVVHRIRHSRPRHGIHDGELDVLPTHRGRPRVVVAIGVVRWKHRNSYIWLLVLLLSLAK
mmetsp:Transcript_252/g.876  ORF Transcript_252/g.876 Transcript_252/m.876 type:complete len:270 (-) Transcript_252:225-1034(-)